MVYAKQWTLATESGAQGTCSMMMASLSLHASCRCSTNWLMYGWRSARVETCKEGRKGVGASRDPKATSPVTGPQV